MNRSSKLHPKFQAGVVVVSGLWGLGKSTLAFTAERPSQTAVLDLELKGEQMARYYGIGFYAAPDTVGDDPFDYDVKLLAKWFVEQVQATSEGIPQCLWSPRARSPTPTRPARTGLRTPS